MSSTWVAVSPDAGLSPVGIACLLYPKSEGKWYVSSVWTDPRYRRKGLGRAMVGYLGECARAAGARELYLWVFSTNQRAIDVYRKLNFAETGERQLLRTGRERRHEIQMKLDLT